MNIDVTSMRSGTTSGDDLRPRILLVDDETNFLWSIARALDVKGFQVATASSVDQALSHLRREHVDLVLTDIKMPGMDGFELVEWVRVHRPEAVVVMATAFGSLSMREKALQLGAISYIEKPIDLNALMTFLQNLFQAPGFMGRIRDIDLLDYLQLINNTHKTKIVQLSNRRTVGRMVFENGQLVHARLGALEGLAAFYEMVSWHSGTLLDVPYDPPDHRTIEATTSFLLMEAARMRDERERPSTQDAVVPPRVSTGIRQSRPTDVRTSDGRSGESRVDGRPAPRSTGLDERSTAIGGTFGRYRRFLEGLETWRSVRGSVLASREGLILARGGGFPSGLEPLAVRAAQALDGLGETLQLGAHDVALMGFDEGMSLLLLPVGAHLTGVWMEGEHEGREIAAWLKGRAVLLEDGRPGA